jgi:hypothetical protein
MMKPGVCVALGLVFCLLGAFGCGGGKGTEAGKTKIEKVETVKDPFGKK